MLRKSGITMTYNTSGRNEEGEYARHKGEEAQERRKRRRGCEAEFAEAKGTYSGIE